MKYIDLLRNRNFVALWIGQVISEFGDRLNQMALIASIYYGMSGTPIFRLAILLSFTIIPVFLVGPIAGVYVDRWNKKHTMLGSDILRGLLVLLIPLFLIKLKLAFPVYIVVFLIFSVSRFFIPAKLGIIPDIVPQKNLLLANSLSTTTRLIAAIVGLGLGGLIVDIFGVKSGFYIDSGTYFLSALAILFIKMPKIAKKTKESIIVHSRRIKEIEKNIFHDIAHSIHYIFHQKGIPYVMKTFFILMSGVGAIYVIFVDFLLKNLSVPSNITINLEQITGFGQFGYVIIFMGLGALIGATLFGRLGHKLNRSFSISISFICTGLFLLLFSYVTQVFKNFWYTCTIVFFLGFSLAPIMIIANTLLHEVTHSEMRGRIFSTLEIVIHLAFLLFMFISIFLVTVLKIPDVIILGVTGILTIIHGVVGCLKKRPI